MTAEYKIHLFIIYIAYFFQIRALASEGIIDELLQYLSLAEKLFTDAYPGTLTYNIVLHAFVKAKEVIDRHHIVFC